MNQCQIYNFLRKATKIIYISSGVICIILLLLWIMLDNTNSLNGEGTNDPGNYICPSGNNLKVTRLPVRYVPLKPCGVIPHLMRNLE
jgi:hypothetical protein